MKTTNIDLYAYFGLPREKKAKSLLAEAGYADTNGNGTLDKDGKELELTLMFTTEEFPEFKTIGEYVQSEFSKIGVKVNICSFHRYYYRKL